MNNMITDCESLIRKMLVLDPHRRYTIEQIKHHRWMLIEVMDPISLACDNQNKTAITEPNEQILRLMAGLGIDTQKTCDSLKVNVIICIITMNYQLNEKQNQ